MSRKYGIARLIYATKYSFDGIVACFKSEAAFRQDCIIALILAPVIFLLDFTTAERCILIASIFILLIAEVLNSAIEKCVDLCSPTIHPLAKFAKDAGSAAVFFALSNLVICLIIILFQKYI